MDTTSHEKVYNAKYGSGILKRISEMRSRNEKFELKWNSRGQAIGENRTMFMNYIGLCARLKVDISIPRWKLVPKQIKEAIWTDISGVFDVPADKQRWVMNIVSRRLTDFKGTLTSKWVYDKDGNVCADPPPVYPFIDKESWDRFLDSRLSDEFKEESEKHREISKKNLYPYRGSRKGYAGIEEEMILANKGKNNPELSFDDSTSPTSIPRSLLWKQARIGKDGNMPDSVRQVVARMDSVSKQAAKGEINLTGRQDILTTALGKIDHPSHVIAAGIGVTISQYFGKKARAKAPPPDVERLNAMEAQMEDLKRMITELRGSNFTLPTEPCEVTPPVISGTTSYMEPVFPEGWTQCELASSEPGNPIVAMGKVFNTHGVQPVMLHNKPLESGYMKVTIIEAKVRDAPLPVPSDEANTVLEAVGEFVAWPKNLIFLNTTLLQPTTGDRDQGMDKQKGIHQQEMFDVTPKSLASPIKHISVMASQLSKRKRGRSENDWSNNLAKLAIVSSQLRPLPSDQVSLHQEKLATSTESRPSLNDQVFLHQQNHTTCTQSRPLQDDEEVSLHKHQKLTTSTQSQPSRNDQVSVHQQKKLTTCTVKLMYRCTRGMTQFDTVTIDMPPAIMHHEQNIQIWKEELLQWLFQEDVQASHVSVYIKYLYNFCKDHGTSEMFGFLRPQRISQDADHHDEKEKAQYIMDVMKGTKKNQIFFAPFNIGRHWVLCAIQPLKDQTYWLDPARNEVHPDIKKVIDMAMRMFYARRIRKKRPRKTKWCEIKCPRQSNDVDCGYYILRYMLEVIQRRLDHIPEEYYADTLAPDAYDQRHIDEIRDTWIEFVQNHMD